MKQRRGGRGRGNSRFSNLGRIDVLVRVIKNRIGVVVVVVVVGVVVVIVFFAESGW